MYVIWPDHPVHIVCWDTLIQELSYIKGYNKLYFYLSNQLVWNGGKNYIMIQQTHYNIKFKICCKSLICICTNRDAKKKIQRKINVYILVDINYLWYQQCINESDYYTLSAGCSFSSINQIKIQVKYILEMFDFC